MTKLNLGILFIILFFTLIFLARYFIIGQAVYGDGIYYYAYTRSIVKDGDLNFENELEHRYAYDTNNTYKETDLSEFYPDTATNHVSNKYPIGPGILWIPPFYFADIVSFIASFLNSSFPSNGYSNIYQIFVGLFNIASVLLGTLFLYKTLLNFFAKKVSLITSVTALFGTNLFYYSAIDSINSHPLSFLFGSLFFFFMFRKKFSERFMILGFISGVLSLIRTQDIIFLFFTLIFLFSRNLSINNKLKNSLLAIFSFAFVFTIQLLAWQIIYGTFFAFPYISQHEGFNFFSPNILGVLFSTKVGLFIWTPFYIFAFIGLFIKRLKIPTIFIMMQVYLISSWSGWTQGESFGVRMIISVLPLLCLGYGSFINSIKPFWRYSLLFLLVVFNFLAIFIFLAFLQNPTIDRGKVTQNQIIERLINLVN